MKIYFTAPARGTSEYDSLYKAIFDTIGKLGHKNLDDLVFKVDPDNFYKGDRDSQVELYENALKLIKKSDLVVLEVSLHSLSMGFVMQKALELGKPVIALYQKGKPPFFAQGIEDDKLQVIEYKEEDLESILTEAIDYAKNQSDTRFNFFISPGQINFLDKISKDRRIPRSVYLRRLIEADMAKNEDYLEQA